MITAGNSNERYCLTISVKAPFGWRKGWLVYSDSLDSIKDVIDTFHNARRLLRRKVNSSQFLFGGKYKRDSLEWLVCHSVSIKIVDQLTDEKILSEIVQHPYLEAINIRF